jgi:hypothetical protein
LTSTPAQAIAVAASNDKILAQDHKRPSMVSNQDGGLEQRATAACVRRCVSGKQRSVVSIRRRVFHFSPTTGESLTLLAAALGN